MRVFEVRFPKSRLNEPVIPIINERDTHTTVTNPGVSDRPNGNGYMITALATSTIGLDF